MELVLMIGVQASGKSSFCREQLWDTHLRLNLDMLRTRQREALLFHACIATQQRCVIDNTNPTPFDRARYIPAARAAGFKIRGYYFDTPLEDALRRNAARNGQARIPDKGVVVTARKLRAPRWEEGFSDLYTVHLIDGQGFVITPYPAPAAQEIANDTNA